MTKTKFLGLAMALCFGAAFSTASIAGDFTADFHLAHGQKCETCHKTAPKAGAKVKSRSARAATAMSSSPSRRLRLNLIRTTATWAT